MVLTVLKCVSQTASRDQILLIYVLCRSIWQRRNDWVWNHVATSPFGVHSRACCMFTEWQRAREDNSVHNTQQHTMVRFWTWCKPLEGWVKINVDAAFVQGTDQVWVGCVIRDKEGNFLLARSTVVRARFQPREAEVMSLKEALTWTK